MFKNLKQKTLNSTPETSIISSRSTSNSSLPDHPLQNDISTDLHRAASTSDISNVEEKSTSFGNIDVVIKDLRRELQKKEADNKRHALYVKDCEKKIAELVDNWNKEVECRQQLELAYEKLEDTNEIKQKEIISATQMDKQHALRALESQCEKLKKDNEKLSRKANALDVKKLVERAELAEGRYNEISEIQEHNEIQIQKMKDLFKLKDEEFIALQQTLADTEANAAKIKEEFDEMSVADRETWKDAQVAEKEANYIKEIEELNDKVIALDIKVSDKDFRINRLREDVKSKEITINNLTSSSAELSATVDRLNESMAAMQCELESCKESHIKTLDALQEELDGITQQYQDEKYDNDKQKQLVEQLQIAAVATKTVKLGLEKELGMVQKKLEEQDKVIDNFAEIERDHTKTAEDFIQQLDKYSAQTTEIEAMKEEIAQLQQNGDELLQEKEYLIVAQESWIKERNDTVDEMQLMKESYDSKMKAMQEDLTLLRSSTQTNILPVSSSLQAKFTKGVTEIDIGNRKDSDEDVSQLRHQCLMLQNELKDKNKLLKQNQQHLNDLKKTLQNEIRGGVPSPGSSRHNPPKYDPDKPLVEDELVNLEYLKHCVIKYMTSPDSETSYLIRVISVLLKFTHEEQTIVQDSLKYKASWFKNPPKSLKKLKSTLGSPTRSP